jgi:hypothetical protein
MTQTTRAFSRAMALALGSALLGLFSTAADAASISYGNFGPVPPGVMFLNVTESSSTDPVPLFGPPTPFATGLDFDPMNFGAAGAGGSGDITDGQLNFTVMSPGINTVGVSEGGDYSLVGFGTPATSVFAGASLRVKVTHINGIDVPDINLGQSNASVGFNLIANPGVLQPWGLGTLIDVAAQLSLLGIPGKATKVEVVINDQLIALSEAASAAFIAKKEFVIDVDSEIPEPSTLALASAALCGWGLSASRRRT